MTISLKKKKLLILNFFTFYFHFQQVSLLLPPPKCWNTCAPPCPLCCSLNQTEDFLHIRQAYHLPKEHRHFQLHYFFFFTFILLLNSYPHQVKLKKFCFIYFGFWNKVLPCSPGWPQTYYINQADLKLPAFLLLLPPWYWDYRSTGTASKLMYLKNSVLFLPVVKVQTYCPNLSILSHSFKLLFMT